MNANATITAAEITGQLEGMGAVELRKLGATMGIKGASKGRKADLVAAIAAIRIAEVEALAAKLAEQDAAAKPVRKGYCTDGCGRRISREVRGIELCTPCYDYASWENQHGDDNHDDGDVTDEQCPVCHPELDPRTPVQSRRSRAGMVIVAKGSEVHKSETFKVAAEAAGWTVSILGSVNLGQDGEEQERWVAVATKANGDNIELAWNGRAYDYPSSSARLGGKTRKVRNLKEALRLI